MANVVLTAATRQNLLSAQNTADLLATTQNRLATGKKVNSALENPLSFFTAQALDSRAGDLATILDNISNGVQTIQAANQGITNIQKTVDSAKSTCNQALATFITTTGSASVAFASPAAATTIAFKVNGVTKTTASLGTTATIDDAVSALNTAAGTSIFSKSSDGTKIVLNGAGRIEFDTANGAKVGFAAVPAADDATTTYYNETANSADLTVNGLEARSNLAKQFNELLAQIDQLANDSSFNGVNLINSKDVSNKLHIQFNSDDSSRIDILGVDATSKGIGLSAIALTTTASFISNDDIKVSLGQLTQATNGLRSYASTLGSSLSVVQNRQDFTKNLANVLQTGSGGLVNADLNEEAANSQALSTRQSLAISALSLANQSQQSILQLLR